MCVRLLRRKPGVDYTKYVKNAAVTYRASEKDVKIYMETSNGVQKGSQSYKKVSLHSGFNRGRFTYVAVSSSMVYW